jgi:hypothetical protein
MIGLILAGCSTPGSGSQPAGVVEAYFKALTIQDLNQMINLSCAAWEPKAKEQFDSFAAVKLSLQDLHCQGNKQEGSTTLVTCSGKIIANYGAENLDIDLAGRTYQTVLENGEWRMCGEQ